MWFKEGDKNTKYFHRMVCAHMRRNWISKIKVGETWLTEKKAIKTKVIQHCEKQLQETGEWRPLPIEMVLNRINASEAAEIQKEFTKQEVHTTSLKLGGDKAPWSDGFSMAFWVFHWEVVKDELLKLVRVFHRTGRLVKALNTHF